MSLTRRHFISLTALAPLAYGVSVQTAAAREPDVFQNPLAINGIDPLGYFDHQKPIAGLPAHSLTWNGAEWRFASAENRDRFRSEPERYAPVFGGYCAYAASLGYLAPTQAEAWTIHEGKLYLNANLRARELWLQDVPGNIEKGLANWPGILG